MNDFIMCCFILDFPRSVNTVMVKFFC